MIGGTIIEQIGIPRTMFYFDYYPLWQEFFNELGLEVVFSAPTNRQTLELGLSTCVDGACLSVKAFIGHTQSLIKQGIKLIFVPQIVSVFRREYTCPYFLGLPDLTRQYTPASTELLSPTVDGKKSKQTIRQSYWRMGREFASFPKVRKAWRTAIRAQREYELSCQSRAVMPPHEKLTILLLGPRYLTDDSFLNGNLVQRLEGLGAHVITVAQLPDQITSKASDVLEKRLFWTGARRSVGALEHFMSDLNGVVNIAPFGCGAESMLGHIIEERIRNRNVSKLELNVDEHTSEVGLVTRLEAFCDLLERKNMDESNISAFR